MSDYELTEPSKELMAGLYPLRLAPIHVAALLEEAEKAAVARVLTVERVAEAIAAGAVLSGGGIDYVDPDAVLAALTGATHE